MKTLFNKRLKYSLLLILLSALVILSGCDDDEIDLTFTDSRDGQTYRTIIIGNQTWMADNLNYKPTNAISWCYDNNEDNCDIYGGLYDWHTALSIAPDGWHLPSDAEWQELVDFLGGDLEAGGKLKEAGFDHWNAPNTGADNRSRFNALPGGNHNTSTNLSYSLGKETAWWSSSSFTPSIAWLRFIGFDHIRAQKATFEIEHAISVRCIKD